MRQFVRVIALFVGAATVTVINGCGLYDEWFGPDAGVWGDCDNPNYSGYNNLDCLESRCRRDADVPTDDCGAPSSESSSSSSSGSSAVCQGTCVPNEPNGFNAPMLVYIGPFKGPYPMECPPDVGAPGEDLQYTDLIVPTPGCPACVCGPIQGTCSPTPEITLHANLCNDPPGQTTPFGGPANWDGSCTNENAVPANLECPPGSGVPCAQSILTSPLPAPEHGCEPIPLPVPRATSDTPRWGSVVLTCSPTRIPAGCAEPASEQCLPPLPKGESGWRYCVSSGSIRDCVESSRFTERHLVYPHDGFVDTRKCTECTCETAGGACFGTLRMYKNDACSTNDYQTLMLSSEGPNCQNLFPPGEALSSKEIVDLTYSPGDCAPKGGEPVGDVELINDELDVDTWCCIPSDQ